MNDSFDEVSQFERSLDRHLAALSKVYGRDGNRLYQEIVVNARPLLAAIGFQDQWNPNTTWYSLYLMLPERLFLIADADRNQICNRIQADLNRVHGVADVFVSNVVIQLDMGADHDWRSQSGLLLDNRRMIAEHEAQRIWQSEGLRVFVSHKSSVKGETGKLQERLKEFGVCCFVAHNDIEATKQWQDVIFQALATMDAFLAIITHDYHCSTWTDQEVGYAIASGVPIVSAKMGADPLGFIGRYQAVSCNWDDAHMKIVPVLFSVPKMIDSFIYAVGKCPDFNTGLMLSRMLESLKGLTDRQIEQLIESYNENRQIRCCYGFNGRGYKNGPGLVHFLNQMSQQQYRYDQSGFIEATS